MPALATIKSLKDKPTIQQSYKTHMYKRNFTHGLNNKSLVFALKKVQVALCFVLLEHVDYLN